MQNHVNDNKLKKVILCAVFSALAYVAMATIKIPVIMFLKYEPKDVIIVLASFIAGPVSGMAISFITSLVEMLSVSDTGIIGFFMNLISSVCYAGVASGIYMKKRSVNGAVLGLVVATLATTTLMIAWNYIVTPWYMGVPRESVVKMLLPMFLPFNLLKYSLNSAIAMLLYKTVSKAVKRAGFGNMIPPVQSNPAYRGSKKVSVGVSIASIFVIATCIMLMLVLGGKI